MKQINEKKKKHNVYACQKWKKATQIIVILVSLKYLLF